MARAGSSEAVALFSKLFQQGMAALRLSLSVDKCEVIPPAGAAFSFSDALFPGRNWRVDGGFKLLGAPLGSAAFCSSHGAKRASYYTTEGEERAYMARFEDAGSDFAYRYGDVWDRSTTGGVHPLDRWSSDFWR